MKKIVLLLLAGLAFACNPDDPQALLLVGRWEFVEYTNTTINTQLRASAARPVFAIFNANGTTGQENGSFPFSGGACNYASTYSYMKDGAYSYSTGKIRFTFSEPRCIPFIYVPEQPIATVVELTDTALLISWNSLLIRYRRT